MTTTRTSTITRRSVRGAALALFTGAGIALTPLAASANVVPAPAPPTSSPAPVTAAPAAYTAAPATYTATPAAYTSAPAANRANAAVSAAMAQVGKPYAWGGTGPSGYDCSGLTFSAYRSAGITLPRTSRAQSTAGVPVAWNNLKPGDLLFYYSPVGHVAMYIGYGQMVHSSTYGNPVSVVPVSSMSGLTSVRRVA